jgi:hypothetical protein
MRVFLRSWLFCLGTHFFAICFKQFTTNRSFTSLATTSTSYDHGRSALALTFFLFVLNNSLLTVHLQVVTGPTTLPPPSTTPPPPPSTTPPPPPPPPPSITPRNMSSVL